MDSFSNPRATAQLQRRPGPRCMLSAAGFPGSPGLLGLRSHVSCRALAPTPHIPPTQRRPVFPYPLAHSGPESPVVTRVIQTASSRRRSGAVLGSPRRAPAGSSGGTGPCGRTGMSGRSPAWGWRWPRASGASPAGRMAAESPGWGEGWVSRWKLCWYRARSGTEGAGTRGNWTKTTPRS